MSGGVAPARKRRWPLWSTLIPLLLGIGVWYVVWSGYRDRLAADIARLVPSATRVELGGFPYRLEATVTPARIGHSGDSLIVGGEADSAVVNRQPWQPDHSVFNLTAPVMRAAVQPLNALALAVRAPLAQASLHIDPRAAKRLGGAPVLARLSIVWERATLSTALLPAPLTADRFEAHVRETPTAPTTPAAAGGASPRPPMQAQIVLAGAGVRMAGGAPLILDAEVQVAATRRLTSYAAWSRGGTAELTRLSLRDATGEVLRLAATGVPDGRGNLLLNGAIVTPCPATVRAAFAAQPAPSELRLRKPVTIAVRGLAGEPLIFADAGPAPTQVLKQEPPCPRLR